MSKSSLVAEDKVYENAVSIFGREKADEMLKVSNVVNEMTTKEVNEIREG